MIRPIITFHFQFFVLSAFASWHNKFVLLSNIVYSPFPLSLYSSLLTPPYFLASILTCFALSFPPSCPPSSEKKRIFITIGLYTRAESPLMWHGLHHISCTTTEAKCRPWHLGGAMLTLLPGAPSSVLTHICL